MIRGFVADLERQFGSVGPKLGVRWTEALKIYKGQLTEWLRYRLEDEYRQKFVIEWHEKELYSKEGDTTIETAYFFKAKFYEAVRAAKLERCYWDAERTEWQFERSQWELDYKQWEYDRQCWADE